MGSQVIPTLYCCLYEGWPPEIAMLAGCAQVLWWRPPLSPAPRHLGPGTWTKKLCCNWRPSPSCSGLGHLTHSSLWYLPRGRQAIFTLLVPNPDPLIREHIRWLLFYPRSLAGFATWQQITELQGSCEQGGSCMSFCGLAPEVTGVDLAVVFWWKQSVARGDSKGWASTPTYWWMSVRKCVATNHSLSILHLASFTGRYVCGSVHVEVGSCNVLLWVCPRGGGQL